jgi:hypothetical protein
VSKIYDENIDVTSRLFEFLKSFKFHPILKDAVPELLQQMTFSNSFDRPSFILLSKILYP